MTKSSTAPTKSIIGHQSSGKGASDDWLIKRIVADIEDTSYTGKKIPLEGDQEPDIAEAQQRAMASRSSETDPK